MSKLLEQMRDTLRVKHYAYSTEKEYINWCKRFILFHDMQHPQELGRNEIEEFLTHLAVDENVSASTQNQAFSGILFLTKHGPQEPLQYHDLDPHRSGDQHKKPPRTIGLDRYRPFVQPTPPAPNRR